MILSNKLIFLPLTMFATVSSDILSSPYQILKCKSSNVTKLFEKTVFEEESIIAYFVECDS